jgi:hypothetical protein
VTGRKAVWHHRDFIFLEGWQDWELRDAEVVEETESCYKIRYDSSFWFCPVTRWIFKNSNSDRIEFCKQDEGVRIEDI